MTEQTDKPLVVMGISLEDYHAELIRQGFPPEQVALLAAQENIL